MDATVAIVKYNAGNVRSVTNALDRLGVRYVWTDDPAELRSAERVIFPGVGAAGPAMQYLRERGLDEVLRSLTQPTLGICLGLQLFCRHSAEADTPCLGVFDVAVRRFEPLPERPDWKVPHMGWNALHDLRGPLFEGLAEGCYVYFVHSFFAEKNAEWGAATTGYTQAFSAALQRDNFFAVQFHPEKSGQTGQKILSNFLKIK
jgi:imidazole glycerol-phosphate synthase subunit HisH